MNSQSVARRFLDLLEIPSSANYETVLQSLGQLTREPLSLEPPGDDAEYITELRIGDIKNPQKVIICFSKHGNLAFAYVPEKPLISAQEIDNVLRRTGWELVSVQDANTVLYKSSGETVHHRFFNYV